MIIMKSTRKRPGARLGQHFLTGQWAAKKLAEAVCVQAGETILEIGPGRGALTRHLLATGAHVVAIEKDPQLVEVLESLFSDETARRRLAVVAADIRDITPGKLGLEKYVVAANIPYYITGEIIRQFLSTDVQPRAMALLVQKEVAQRIVARNRKESVLSISVKVYGTPKIVAGVSRGNFSPPPSVDSAILLINDISKKSFVDQREDAFFKVVKAGFSSKRKFLASNLINLFEKEKIERSFTNCKLPHNIRAEDVPFGMWNTLARDLT